MDSETLFDTHGNPYLKIRLTDYALITNSLLNKGMAFTEQEREEFGLFGLLPPRVATLNEQRIRSYEAFCSKNSDLEKYLYLRDLQDSNETLFYSLLCNHFQEIMPIVYTPTVGLGCQRLSHVYRRPRGIFVAYPYRDRIEKILSNPHFDQVEVIVVSDGERILGLGDQGAGGMGIPIGKLALYTACAGIHPSKTLPILLDTGTNNPELINDPLYIGWRHERIRGQDYTDFIDSFVQAVKQRFPKVLLHWEDFAQNNANPILERYRDELCTFNDDIQGTAAVAIGALLAAVQLTGLTLAEQRIVIVGAGSAGCGISSLLVQAMMAEGLSAEAARANIFLVDRNGLLIEGMSGLLAFQQPFVQKMERTSNWVYQNSQQITLAEVVSNVHPTVLVGVSGQPGIFNAKLVQEMAAHVLRPIIMPLSNPTALSEATPADLLAWTAGRAIISTGSPFAPIRLGEQLRQIDQTNNAYIFPGLGLGLIAVKSQQVSDSMILAAAKALASCSPAKNNHEGSLLPSLTDIREVSKQIAFAVAKTAVDSGLAEFHSDDELIRLIEKQIWQPVYWPYKKL